MSHITAEEWQLLSLFAVEPTLSDPDVPWCYNHAVYEVRQGPLVLRCELDPAYRDVQIVIEHGSLPLYQFAAKAVKDVRYAADGGVERLEVDVNDRDGLSLRIVPRIHVTHQCDGSA